ncbi:unnamed protein product [Arctia plantaginis]|uniref:Ig-like domain-containing protein n=1 Tax=Arctia plantaginis TaxID=874455 RepID=A0A8S0YV14_ARCPL|nr:unnamed protein product [Arctia plantaginis]CAB3247956.1 unnamed protein product [Arctia plantaginis]
MARSTDTEEPTLSILARSTVYNINETKAIFCEGHNLLEPIQWYTPSGKLVEERSIKNKRVFVERRESGTLAVLIMHSIKISDGGNWTCKSGELQETREFIVGEKVSLPVKNVSMEGEESKSIKLTCEAVGYPAPVVVWYKEKQAISDKEPPKKYVIGDDHSLTIKKLNHADAGVYTCKVRQKALSHYTEKTVQLYVQHKPIIYRQTGENPMIYPNQKYKTEEVYAILNDTKNVTCSAIAHPPPVFAWNRRRGGYDDSPITDPDTVMTAEDGSNSVLILRLYNESYFGEYRCSATNSKGSESIIFHVSPGTKPDPPDYVSLYKANVTELTFNVSCSSCIFPDIDDPVTPDPKVVLAYSFQFVKVNNSYEPDWTASIDYEVDVTYDSTLYTVGPLENSTAYHAQVRTRNAAGYSEWIDIPGEIKTLNNAMKFGATLLLVFCAIMFTSLF